MKLRAAVPRRAPLVRALLIMLALKSILSRKVEMKRALMKFVPLPAMRFVLTLLATIISFSSSVHATLIDRGGGLIYDDVLNITWLQDANYAYTSGYALASDYGGMSWADANAWAANLNYYDSVTNTTYTGWRLPDVQPINGSSFNYAGATDGSTDYGYNVGAPGTLYAGSTGSELAYMYFTNLGNSAYRDPTGAIQPVSGLVNTGPFINAIGQFWTSTAYEPIPGNAWTFRTFGVLAGFQDNFPQLDEGLAWAVHDGDIGAGPVANSVPEAMPWWLLPVCALSLVALQKFPSSHSQLRQA
jgi:hypothetical protein